MAEGEIAKAAALKPDEVPDGVSGDTVWKVADNLFTISVLPKDAVPAEIGDLNDLIVGGTPRNAGAISSPAPCSMWWRAARSHAPTRHARRSRRDVDLLLRDAAQTGRPVFTKIIATGVEVPPTIERAIKDLDAKVRSVITAALAKL